MLERCAPSPRARRAPGPCRHDLGDPSEKLNRLTSIPFFLVHLPAAAGASSPGVTATAVVLCVVLYYGRMFFITAGYHRYFSHRSYQLSRVLQFVLAFGGTTRRAEGRRCGGPRTTATTTATRDTEHDLHSPLQGLLVEPRRLDPVRQVQRTPTATASRTSPSTPSCGASNKHDWIAPWIARRRRASSSAAGAACVVGFFLVDRAAVARHVPRELAGPRVRAAAATPPTDTSRNSLLIALLTVGEGWHNNHHYYQASARQGFFWWEIDATYYVLKVLSWVGIVQRPQGCRRRRCCAATASRTARFDIGMFRRHWGKASRPVHAAAGLARPARARPPGRCGRGDSSPPGIGRSRDGGQQGRARGVRAPLARVGRGSWPSSPHQRAASSASPTPEPAGSVPRHRGRGRPVDSLQCGCTVSGRGKGHRRGRRRGGSGAPSTSASPGTARIRTRCTTPCGRGRPSPRAPATSAAYLLTGFAECEAVLRDPALELRTRRTVRCRRRHRRAHGDGFTDANILLFIDPPDHTRIRKLVSKAFTPRRSSSCARSAGARRRPPRRGGRAGLARGRGELGYKLPVIGHLRAARRAASTTATSSAVVVGRVPPARRRRSTRTTTQPGRPRRDAASSTTSTTCSTSADRAARRPAHRPDRGRGGGRPAHRGGAAHASCSCCSSPVTRPR